MISLDIADWIVVCGNNRAYGVWSDHQAAQDWLHGHCGGETGREPCPNGQYWFEHRVARLEIVNVAMRRT